MFKYFAPLVRKKKLPTPIFEKIKTRLGETNTARYT